MKRAPRSAFFKAWKCQFFRLKSRNAFSHILQEDFIQLKNKGMVKPAAIILRYFSFFRSMFINPNNSIENGNAPWRIEKELILTYTCFEAFKCTVMQKKTNKQMTLQQYSVQYSGHSLCTREWLFSVFHHQMSPRKKKRVVSLRLATSFSKTWHGKVERIQVKKNWQKANVRRSEIHFILNNETTRSCGAKPASSRCSVSWGSE